MQVDAVPFGKKRAISKDQEGPYEDRLCACGDEVLESLTHVLFECSLHRNDCNRLLSPVMRKCPGRPLAWYLSPGIN